MGKKEDKKKAFVRYNNKNKTTTVFFHKNKRKNNDINGSLSYKPNLDLFNCSKEYKDVPRPFKISSLLPKNSCASG